MVDDSAECKSASDTGNDNRLRASAGNARESGLVQIPAGPEVVDVSPRDTIVESPSVEVVYVGGDKSEPIPVQAPKAVAELENRFSSLRGLKFFGVVVDGQYRACVRNDDRSEASSLGMPGYVIPGGRYVHRRLTEWNQDAQQIGEAVADLTARPDFDPGRPVIEYYRSHTEIVIKVPVK